VSLGCDVQNAGDAAQLQVSTVRQVDHRTRQGQRMSAGSRRIFRDQGSREGDPYSGAVVEEPYDSRSR